MTRKKIIIDQLKALLGSVTMSDDFCVFGFSFGDLWMVRKMTLNEVWSKSSKIQACF